MINWELFHFLRPYWLILFVPLAFIVWFTFKRKIGSKSWESICDKELLPFILIGNTSASRHLPTILLMLCGSLAILALAGPVWEKLPHPVYTTQSALVITLDMSRSMDAADISPTRLARARYKISDILAKRAEGQTALLVYAGDVFTVAPLTDDYATIELLSGALSTDIMPLQGNRTDMALSNAVDLLKQAGASKGDILLITDEIDFDRTRNIAQTIRNDGYRLSVLGVGTMQGAPITLSDGSFLRDRTGQIVVPTLNEQPMRDLAGVGGGLYNRLSTDDADVDSITRFFSSNFSDEDIDNRNFETDIWYEHGQWLVVLLIPFVALVFRRGYLMLLIVLVLPYPQQSHAFEWGALWARPDQRGIKAFENEQHERAADLFTDPAWKGSAQYRAEKFDEAIASFQGRDDLENTYNLGNALARKGMYEQAIAAYDKVLSQMPDHDDAKFNKELLEKELEEQQQEQQQEQEPGQSDSQEQPDDENQQQSQQGQNEESEDQRSGEEQLDDMQDGEQNQAESEPHEDIQESMEEQSNEEKLATEQWLRRIPDDPGGLLRRKFMYQYLQRQHEVVPGEKQW